MRDLAAALAHYSALGFDASAYADGRGYGFADRDRSIPPATSTGQ